MYGSLRFVVGLLLLFSLNGVRLIPQDIEDLNSSEMKKYVFCTLDNCPADTTYPHYGCTNTENWLPACGNFPKLISITNKIKKYLVNRHNTFRNIVARGDAQIIPRAGRMCKLSWDNDLADVAEVLVRRCDLRPTNSCISTLEFPAPGFNAIYNKFKKNQDPYRIVRSQLSAWYNEYKYVEPLSIVDGSSIDNQEVGHFLRMMVGPSNRLGCVMAVTKRDGWNYHWLICLYSCSPKNNSVLYEYTPVPAALCTKGVDSKYKHLCSDDEVVDSCKPSPMFNTEITTDTASQIQATMKHRLFLAALSLSLGVFLLEKISVKNCTKCRNKKIRCVIL